MKHLVLGTLIKFADVNMSQRQGQNRHILAGFLLPEVYLLIRAKINVQSLPRLDHNKVEDLRKYLDRG